MDHMGILSLIPPIVAVVLAIISKNVIIALFSGVFIGVLLLVGGNPLTATTSTIGDYIFPQLTDGYNAAVLVLLFFIGGFVALMEKSGGGAALATSSAKFFTTRARAQLGAWFGGIIIFFSDLGTPLIVGPVFEKIFDKAKISREKLAWIIDSTSSPVAVLIPFIGWGVYIMGLIRAEFDKLNITDSEFSTLVAVIPFQFYAILAVLLVPVIALTKLDFGPMAKAEQRVRETGQLYWAESKPLRKPEVTNEYTTGSRAILVWLPLLVLFITLFGLLVSYGFPFEPVPGGDFRVSLSTAYLFAAITIVLLMLIFKVKKFGETVDIYTTGMQKMVYVATTLVLAWALGQVIGEMGTANYIVEMMKGNIPAFIIPAILFVVGAIMAIASGTSWGTFAIMLPIAIPMAVALDAHLLVCIGAVLSGGIFGDHCSPISDTTILSSTGAGADHIDHVKTQFPYALLNAVAAFIGFVVAGITGSVYTIFLSVAIIIVVAWILSRRQEKSLTS
ncbi:sodium:proton exchanger [Sporosarcina sp. P21c]|uniref:Na+/H+ antiporter NhaC family protein n=1 Tax=unclassified Sporosarcina TaxID=2647733 RepID=UPI000C16EAEB|nr:MULTISPECIES: Na+/H+ antiporter NhaC family protein [unclassified Sporosarcina]PIC66338.1 sodium:proton exchanger [Sporosarcina sp. P16a]PIC82628.1 sodium:proton exchanger [Sporosarcina sp. P1]PIC89221.1 sodium:proton exchanger [Sporosarcina sp. P21c]PIC92290.1 sodium:proton exchanger [Sporosarcina sp. P25]